MENVNNMDVDISAAFDAFAQVTSSAASVTHGMSMLIDYSEGIVASPIWAELRSLDYGSDVAKQRIWLQTILTSEPPPSSVKAFWFGIFNPIIDDETSCGYYISGATDDYSAKSLDWACWKQGTYLPRDQYASSEILAELYRASESLDELPGSVDEFMLLGEFTLCLGYVSLLVAELARSIEPRLFLGAVDQRHVAVGFDSGNPLLVGIVGKHGLLHAGNL